MKEFDYQALSEKSYRERINEWWNSLPDDEVEEVEQEQVLTDDDYRDIFAEQKLDIERGK